MKAIKNIVNLFVAEPRIECSENEAVYLCLASSDTILYPEVDTVLSLLGELPVRDVVEISIGRTFEPVYLQLPCKENFCAFIEDIKQKICIEQIIDENIDEPFLFTLKIRKRVEQSVVSLYNMNAFLAFLNALSLFDVLSLLQDLSKEDLIFEVFEQSDAFATNAFRTKYQQLVNGSENCDDNGRHDTISRTRSEVCHFNNASNFNFTPDNFYMTIRSGNDSINLLFDRLCVVFSLVYLCDISEISNDTVSLRLNGYKTLTEDLDYKSIDVVALEPLFKVYQWIYGGGNLSDKMGIARNLLSLYAGRGLLHIEEGLYSSIRSGYEIYLKDNVQSYLALKNQITDKVVEMSQKANSYIEGFTSSFKQNIAATLTFFITLVVLSSIDKEKYAKIFSKDVVTISMSLIVISLLHLLFCVIEFNRNTKRFDELYHYLRSSYDNILDRVDLNEIFRDDMLHDKDMTYLKKQLQHYSWLWLMMLFVLLLSIVVLART